MAKLAYYMEFSLTNWNVPLISGLIGAVISQLLSAFFQRKLEIRRTQLDVLRKISGSRAAAALGTLTSNDRLIDLFKAICLDVGIEPRVFNDSLFLEPFTPGPNP